MENTVNTKPSNLNSTKFKINFVYFGVDKTLEAKKLKKGKEENIYQPKIEENGKTIITKSKKNGEFVRYDANTKKKFSGIVSFIDRIAKAFENKYKKEER